MEPSTDFTPTTALIGGSPKMMYTFFLLSECKNYLAAMKTPNNVNVDTTTNSLLAFCPDVATRDRLFSSYIRRKEKEQLDDVTASILTIGDFQAYLSEVLEFTESSTGGF